MEFASSANLQCGQQSSQKVKMSVEKYITKFWTWQNESNEKKKTRPKELGLPSAQDQDENQD